MPIHYEFDGWQDAAPVAALSFGRCGHVSDIRIIVIIDAFRKKEQVKKVFWTLFVAMAGLVLARVVDPVTTQQVVGIITGRGDNPSGIFLRSFFLYFFRD